VYEWLPPYVELMTDVSDAEWVVAPGYLLAASLEDPLDPSPYPSAPG
jgi:hypothetical protein